MAAFTVIDHTELGAAAASWAVSSIPSSYDHLYIVASERNSNSAFGTAPYLRVGNGSIDTGTNYSKTDLDWRLPLSAPVSVRTTGDSFIQMFYGNNNSNTANSFSAITIWIPNYANTANFKQIIANASNVDMSTSSYTQGQGLHAGLWSSTSAITDVSIIAAGGGGGDQHMQYSTFTLYGVTGA